METNLTLAKALEIGCLLIMSSFFGKIADDLIDAHEQVYTQVVKGASDLFGKDGRGGALNSPGSKMDSEDIYVDGLDDMRSPLEGIADSVIGDIFESQVGPQTPLEHIDAFRSAINWSEPFVRYLIVFQAIAFMSTVYVCKSKNSILRFVFLVSISVIVKSAEYLNRYGAANWESFATQNYFDHRGIFLGIMLSAPLLTYSFIMLISFVREATGLLVDVKKMEMKQKRRKESKASKAKKKKQ